jgi:hypothetical protein
LERYYVGFVGHQTTKAGFDSDTTGNQTTSQKINSAIEILTPLRRGFYFLPSRDLPV